MSKSRHFEAVEYECNCGCGDSEMSDYAMQVFDMLRDAVRRPLVVLSGKRCKHWNTIVGGEDNSAHLTGEALDIRAVSGIEKYDLVSKALTLGIKRIGVGKTFIHIDTAAHLPLPVIWGY